MKPFQIFDMILALAFGTATVAVAQPPPARSSAAPVSIFAAFHNICLDTQGEPGAAMAQADALGWAAPAANDVMAMGDLALSGTQQAKIASRSDMAPIRSKAATTSCAGASVSSAARPSTQRRRRRCRIGRAWRRWRMHLDPMAAPCS
jgi:hypothetical protein